MWQEGSDERAMAGQSSAHTKRTDDRPVHRTLVEAREGMDDASTLCGSAGGWAGADGGAAGRAFRVLGPPSGGRASP
jgi:hypothetical protein